MTSTELITTLTECAELHCSRTAANVPPELLEKHKLYCKALRLAVEKLEKKKPGVIPTLEEVLAHAESEKVPATEAAKFFHWHEGKGWVTGANPVKKWKSAFATWRMNWEERNPQAARARKLAMEGPKSQSITDPGGWPDWLESKNLPYKAHAGASGWMRDEFKAWMQEGSK